MANLGAHASNVNIPKSGIVKPGYATYQQTGGTPQVPPAGVTVNAASDGTLLEAVVTVAGRHSGAASVLAVASLTLYGFVNSVAGVYVRIDGGSWQKIDQFYWNAEHMRELGGATIFDNVTAGSHTVQVGWDWVITNVGYQTECAGALTLIEL